MPYITPFDGCTQPKNDYIFLIFDRFSSYFVYKSRLQLAHTHDVLLHAGIFAHGPLLISYWAIHRKGRYGAIWAMVSEDESKLGAIPTFPLRMQRALRSRVEVAAGANRRSVNSEIVARLAQSFDIGAPIEPGEPVASATAREALRRIKAIEDALRAVCDDKCVNSLPDDVREIFVKLGELLYAP
jgi:hypothetical protein